MSNMLKRVRKTFVTLCSCKATTGPRWSVSKNDLRDPYNGGMTKSFGGTTVHKKLNK